MTLRTASGGPPLNGSYLPWRFPPAPHASPTLIPLDRTQINAKLKQERLSTRPWRCQTAPVQPARQAARGRWKILRILRRGRRVWLRRTWINADHVLTTAQGHVRRTLCSCWKRRVCLRQDFSRTCSAPVLVHERARRRKSLLRLE